VAPHQRHRSGLDRVDHGLRHAGLRLAVEAVAAKLSAHDAAARESPGDARVRERFDQADALLVTTSPTSAG
jgi:hypothetical protein